MHSGSETGDRPSVLKLAVSGWDDVDLGGVWDKGRRKKTLDAYGNVFCYDMIYEVDATHERCRWFCMKSKGEGTMRCGNDIVSRKFLARFLAMTPTPVLMHMLVDETWPLS